MMILSEIVDHLYRMLDLIYTQAVILTYIGSVNLVVGLLILRKLYKRPGQEYFWKHNPRIKH